MRGTARGSSIPQCTCTDQQRRPRLRKAASIVVGALATGILLAACGDGPSTSGVAAVRTTTTISRPSAGAGPQAKGLLAYSACMRSHGVPGFPDPTGSGGIPKQAVESAFQNVSSSQADAASEDCEPLLPPGGSLSGQSAERVTARDQQDYLRAAACMRSHGVTNFPDPTFSGGSVNLHIPSSIDTRSVQFTRAAQTCTRLIPSGLPYSRPGA
jgi:hypothetical protein